MSAKKHFAGVLTQPPALWGGGTTYENLNPGVPLFLVNPNCGCFDPQKTLVLNPAAWTDAAPGTFGTSAPYYNNYRWQRQPSESLSIGRIFRIREQMALQIRMDFQNPFNRVFLTPPSVGGPFGVNTATAGATSANGTYTSGYGFTYAEMLLEA